MVATRFEVAVFVWLYPLPFFPFCSLNHLLSPIPYSAQNITLQYDREKEDAMLAFEMYKSKTSMLAFLPASRDCRAVLSDRVWRAFTG